MDVPLTQPNCGAESCLSPTQTVSLENLELNCTTYACQETKEKDLTIVEDVRFENSIPIQKMSVNEHVLIEEHVSSATTSNSLTDSAVAYPVATTSVTPENPGENRLTATQMGLSLEDGVETTGAEKMKVSSGNGIKKSHPENAVKRSRGRPRKNPIKSAVNEIKVEETDAEKMKVIADNGIEESHPGNTIKRSRGRPKKSPIKSAENGIRVEEANAERMQDLAENKIEESHPEIAFKRSRGRPRKSPMISPANGIRVVEANAEKMQVLADNKIEESHPEIAFKRSRGRPRKSPRISTENGIRVEETNTEKMQVLAENKIIESHPENTVKRSRGRPRKSSIQSAENGVRVEEANEFSRIRTHLRYLFHRMTYEQNLIDAYSGEGWKGQSAEKLRPEKELQRAKSEISRCKLKVRNLFQRIDASIAEGRLPESLFDSKGEIDCEDIFCAKCGLRDVTFENDIILCDGACQRAFHQFCVQPPLLKEDIPPDDVGWLCPGCNCKDDCLDLLNDSQGTRLSILDSWEKVYPEAAAAAGAGKTLDSNLDLPSDDSEDDDYEPIDSEVEEKAEGDESSSDDSVSYSVSEDADVAPTNEQNLQLSSDDSEDDDFDPDATDDDNEDNKQQSSGSDFSSDPEDLNVLVDVGRSPGDNSTMPSELVSGSSKVGRGKRLSLNDELSSLLETASSQGDSALISLREVEMLDYKKLYDEQYGNVSTDSSDDEYFDATDAPKRRRNSTESGKVPRRRALKKLNTANTNISPIKSCNTPSEPGSSSGGAQSSAARRLGEAATQGLLISFKENQYPERAKKEKLAEELGITVNQVSKWFENARWSFRHSSISETKLAEIPKKDAQTQQNPKPEIGPNISIDGLDSEVQSEAPSDMRGEVLIESAQNAHSYGALQSCGLADVSKIQEDTTKT